MNVKHSLNKLNNDIINKFLLFGGKFMPELLWDPKVKKYSACGPFTQNTQRINKFLNTGLLSEIYKHELEKACFQHDMAYNKYKDLKGRAQSDIVLKNKACSQNCCQSKSRWFSKSFGFHGLEIL